MPEITVSYNKKQFLLPLNENGNLDLKTLKQYCPKAVGLCYKHEDGKTHGLALCMEEIIIDPGVNTYDVHIIVDSSPSDNIPANKRSRIDEILAKIHGGKENDHQNVQAAETNEQQSLKSPKRLKKCGKQRKTLHVGWLHRSTPQKKYQQIKKPMGGIRDLKLDCTHEYSVKEIKETAVQNFTSDENCKLLSDCTIQLGFFDGQTMEEFKDINGQSCGLWKYCKSVNISSYRLSLYILTTIKVEDAEDGIDNEDNAEENRAGIESQQVDGTVVEARSTEAVSINSNEKDDIRIFYHFIRESKYSDDKSIVELQKNDLYLYRASEDDFTNFSVDEFDPLDQGYSISRIEQNGRVLLQIDIDENLKKSFHFPSATDNVSGNIHSIVHDIDEVQGLYNRQFGLGIIPNCTDSCKPNFTWMKNGNVFKQGEFLYWINNVYETSDESPATWAVIVSCNRSIDETKSNPAQTDSNFAAEQFGSSSLPMESSMPSFISISSIPSTIPSIPCTISFIPSTISSIPSTISSIPFIKREDLKISKILLGAGAQGKVRKGTWLSTDVAVKSIKLFNTNLKSVLRELNVSNLIRHPNIIQTMAICQEPKQLHIVMELFQSNPLSDVLFDDDIKAEYGLNIGKKNAIGNQICQAVSYLHCQANAIIHGDLKPDNILLNSNGIVKLCDLGLSKFTQMATALRSTIGTKATRGTPIFMAPEQFIEKNDATRCSDIWALACTLIELYSATSVWNLDDDENQENALRENLTNKKIPELDAIPTELKDIIKTCFSHDISEQPMAVDLQKVFNTLI